MTYGSGYPDAVKDALRTPVAGTSVVVVGLQRDHFVDHKTLVGGVADFDFTPRLAGVAGFHFLIVVFGPVVAQVFVAFVSFHQFANKAVLNHHFKTIFLFAQRYGPQPISGHPRCPPIDFNAHARPNSRGHQICRPAASPSHDLPHERANHGIATKSGRAPPTLMLHSVLV